MNSSTTKTQDLYVFFHVNKTGGTTFTTHIENLFKHDPYIAPMLNPYQRELAEKQGRTYWPNERKANKLKARIVSGHDANPKNIADIAKYRSVKYITFFRDPGSRILSLFNHEKSANIISPEVTFIEYLKTRGVDASQLCFFLSCFLGWKRKELCKLYNSPNKNELLNTALNEIKKFFFVGLHSNYEQDINTLTNLLKIPKVSRSYHVTGKDIPKHQSMTQELSHKIKQALPIEYQFYESVISLRKPNDSPFISRPPVKV